MQGFGLRGSGRDIALSQEMCVGGLGHGGWCLGLRHTSGLGFRV